MERKRRIGGIIPGADEYVREERVRKQNAVHGGFRNFPFSENLLLYSALLLAILEKKSPPLVLDVHVRYPNFILIGLYGAFSLMYIIC